LKVTVFLKIAKGKNKYIAQASTKKNWRPIKKVGYNENTFYPTIQIPIELNLPNDTFDKLRGLHQLAVENPRPCLNVDEKKWGGEE
jgi:hypothetical protein